MQGLREDIPEAEIILKECLYMKQKTKFTWRALAAATAMLVFLGTTACGAKSSAARSDSYEVGGSGYSKDAYYAEADSFDALEESGAAQEVNESVTDTAARSGEKSAEKMDDKIIRTANVEMKSADAQKCYDTLARFAKENGGSEISVHKSFDNYGDYEYLTIQATLKIAPDKLEEFIVLAEKTDKVTSSEISSDDVTRDYYDIKLRLESKKKALKNYYDLLAQAKTISESLEIQRYITDLTAEIESMEGTLRYYDSKVDQSTIYLSIRQINENAPEIEEFEWDSLTFNEFVRLMKNGFMSVLNFLWSLLLWLVIAVVVLSPVLLIAGVVFFFVRRWRKKHPKAPKEPKKAAQTVYYVPTYGAPQAPNPQPTEKPENKK